MHDLGNSGLKFENTIVIFKIIAVKFVQQQSFVKE